MESYCETFLGKAEVTLRKTTLTESLASLSNSHAHEGIGIATWKTILPLGTITTLILKRKEDVYCRFVPSWTVQCAYCIMNTFIAQKISEVHLGQ